MPQQETAYSLGFDRDAFITRLAKEYQIKHRRTGKNISFGAAMAERKAQAEMARDVLDSLRAGGPVGWIMLKPRRCGWSTFFAILGLELASRVGWDVGIMAHEEDSTRAIYDIAKIAYERLPSPRPELRYSRLNRLVFGTHHRATRNDSDDPGDMNSLACKTAGGHHPFSGQTIRFAHLDEVAKWPGNAKDQWQAINSVANTMPTDGPTLMVWVSTANGSEGAFYETYLEAQKYADRPGYFAYRPHFMPWFADEGSRMVVAPEHLKAWDEWDKEDREREAELVARFNLSKEQLFFRRHKSQKLGGWDFFSQEYPATWQEAFLASGRGVFAMEHIEKQRRNTCKPVFTGEIVGI